MAPKEFIVPEIKGLPAERATIKSKYEEDVHENGHQAVWGSYWNKMLGWGYKCCFSFDKRSKCRGEEGKIETIKREYELEMKVKLEKEAEEQKRIEEQNKKF